MSVTLPTHDWDFRQTVSAGGTVKDNINGTFATYNNGLTSDPTKGLDLSDDNGEGDNYKFASLEPFNTGTEFSMEFYFQKTAHDYANSFPFLIAITNSSSSVTTTDNFFSLSWAQGGKDLFSYIKGTTGPRNTLIIDDANVYAHVVFTFNDTTKELKQYLNSSLVLTETLNKSFTDTTYTYNYVGATPVATNRQFNSYLYYFRYWRNGILSSSEIATLYANRATTNYFGAQPLPIPTHDWDFRQIVSSGGTIGDNVNGTTATLTGVSADATNGAALTNSNHTDYIALTPFNTGTEFSMEFYFQKLTVTSTNWPVLIHMSDAQTGYGPHFCYFQHDKTNNDQQTAFNSSSSYGKSDSTNLIFADNDYVHFVVTWNDTSKELNHYLNGSLVDTVTLSSISFTDSNYTYNYLGNNTNLENKGYNANFYYFRYWKNGILSSSEISTLYANRAAINYFSLANMRINYGDVYLIQNLIKTLADYKAENIPLQDVSFGAFPANKYKQSYVRDLLDVSGSFIQRQHIFYSDMSFNVSDLSADQVIVNNDLSINSGINIFQDSSLNSHVGIVGDVSINGTLTIEDNSIPESALNFGKPASNFGTFDSTQDVSMSSTFTLQGDYERFIDLSQNIQTDFSENIVMIPSSLSLDLSGGTATLSGKTGDQAFLNGTYIVEDNSGNHSGKIYDDLNYNLINNAGPTVIESSNISNFPSGVVSYSVTHSTGQTATNTSGEELVQGSYSWSVTENAESGNNSNLIRQLNGSTSTSYWFGINNGTLDVNDIVYVDENGSNVTINGGTDSQHYILITPPRLMTIGQVRFASHIGSDINKVAKNVYVVGTDANGVKRLLGSKAGSDMTYNTTYYVTLESTPVSDVYFIWQSRNGYHAVDIHAFQYQNVKLQTTTINYDNKLTSLPERWNKFQLQNGGGWLYDGSSNYTSYIDQYGRTKTVNGDNYDLTLPFHFYPSKAFLRTLPGVPKGSTNPDNYPASVKFFGKSQHNDLSSNFYLLGEFENKATIVYADSSANYTHNSLVYLSTLPTAVYSWDFRVDTSTSISDSIQNVTATYYQTSSTVEDGLAYTGTAAHATIPSGILIGDNTNEISFEIYFKYTTALGNWDFIFDIQINSSNQLRMTADGDRGYFAIKYGNANPSNGVGTGVDAHGNIQILNLSTTALVDTWIHFIATIEYPSDYTTNGVIIRYYHNGSLINTVTGARYNTGTAATTTTEYIGTSDGSNSAVDSNGNMRYLRFFNKRLSQEEITSLYNSRDNRDAFNGQSDNYIHGADFLYDLNRKYYVNQLRMIVDKAPDSSGNSYGEYLIDRLAYSGSSFSGKKMESNNPNLYLNTAYDISYGFTEDHSNSVYDLSYNKNQFSILDVSGGGVVQVNPTIRLEDSSLNTEKITSGAKIGVHYDNKLQTLVSSFNNDFYNYLGIRDASGLYNNRISNDGKTIVALNNRGTEAYDASNAEVVFSTDYGKNWKDVLKDCSDTFLFNENDVSYNNLFATGDASGAIDIATSGNGRTMYLGRQSNVFTVQNNYSALGKTDPPFTSIPTDRSSGFPQSMFTDTYPFSSSTSTTQNYTLSSSNNKTGITEAEGTYTLSAVGNWTFYTAYGGYSPSRQLHNVGYNTSIYGDMRHPNGGGLWSYNYTVSNAIDANGNSASYTIVGIKFDFPSTITLHPTHFKTHTAGSQTARVFGEDVNGVTRLLFNQNISPSNSGSQYSLSNIGDGLKSITWGISSFSGGDYYRLYNFFFLGNFSYGSGNPGIPIPTSGVPEIYTTNYGNSWKISPFKFHRGPTIISGDGSTILLLQEDKLNNDRHGYVSSLGNETHSIDCHWLTTDYGATWRTLNRTGHDASDDTIPPSYGSKTATFFKACMSYSGQYIYIYNVQCTTNSNYGELYYSHDYGVTFNKWVTSEAQTVITGTGQISCSGSGKYVYIAGTNASSAFVYYRSTDYGISFNNDITKFPWQSYTLSESSTSAGPFISYEGDLIVTAGSNTTVTTGNSDLQYSLDYGVNYNDLSLNSDTISNITNSFTNLPNKTNTLFTTTDASTKTGIFANSPGPNEYKFLTNVLGQTDVSNIYLQTIEFPKENPTKTIENEGPVFFTSEEPIDKENDFGQNISNSSIGSNKLWNIAVSEDGQKLLGGGAFDISNGAFYAGYNLTNAKFPPTEKVVTDAVPTPAYYWDFRRSTVSEAQVDTIQQKSFYTWQGVNVSTTTGAVVDDQAPTDSLVINNITLDTNFTIELFYKKNANTINSPGYNALFQLNSPSEVHFNMGNVWYRPLQGAIWIHSSWTSDSGGYPYNGNYADYLHEDDTEYHLVLVFNSDTNTFTEYRNNSALFTHTSLRTGQQHTYEIFTLGGATGRQASSNGTTSGQEPTFVNRTSLNQEGNYYYLRFYNTALTAGNVNTLFNGRSTVDYNNWTSYTNLANIPHIKTANLSYDGNQALLVPYGITQTTAQNLYYWTASGDFHRFDGSYLSNFDTENWKFGKLSGDGNFFVGFTHSSTTLSDASYNSDTWWTDPVSNNMIIYKTMQKISKGTVADATATTEAGGTTYDLNNAFASDSGVTSYYITHVNVSETGQYILIVGGNSASTYTNRCALSSDFGVTFSDISSKFSFTDVTKALVYCHVSDNGRYLFISQYNSSEYCFSSDYGSTFTLRNTFPSSTKTYGVVSRDGQNALFADTNKYAYTSVNGNFRQEAIPALSGVNSELSLTHNNWKYTSTLLGDLTYNPSMPNIKYFLGTEEESITTPTFYWDFRQTVSAGGTVTDSISGNIATLSSSNATCTTTGGLTIPSDNSASGTGYADFQAFTTSSNGFSVEMYYYSGTTSWNVTPFHIGNNVTASDNLIFGVLVGTSGTYNHYHIINNTYNNNPNVPMNDNQTYHIVITLDTINSVYTIYNDGVQVFQATDGTGFTGGTFPVISSKNFTYNRIGARGDSKRGLNGNCYYFRFWNGTAITSSEVSTLYANRTTTNYTFTTPHITSSTVRYTGSYFTELDIKGSLTNLSGTGYTSSDYRVKKNVTSLDEADTIASLVPVSYTQNNLHHKKAVGFIAHEFAEIFPDLVIGEKDGPEMQSINYNGVIALLIKETQSLRAKINELKSQI